MGIGACWVWRHGNVPGVTRRGSLRFGLQRGHSARANWIVAVAFLPDGKTVVSASVDGTVRMTPVPSERD